MCFGGELAAASTLLGKAAGTLNTLQQFGAVFGIAIIAAIFNTHGSLAGPAAVTAGTARPWRWQPGCRPPARSPPSASAGRHEPARPGQGSRARPEWRK